ncbi:MAG: ribosomal RNA small subunit methyltransferase A [Candidatus Komeilibacteria bacterium RIFCSPLOWO2_02_FULL_48_11]|uniref:Ribosomal RNA small subunit methyltransferase A n=1 Tax=Candidatus Komeilibacteria bacterium RIFCSPLOWO2_02_FULL_48_11 TaxID=1798553 RepID=A0A1G2BVY3_9BACT|nr:MAG: ribosomal RNA small subunit methyltransferase A [Candidatus Komeilibacteria bacterium RIFCSPLOWO2_02_FULL_48_11]
MSLPDEAAIKRIIKDNSIRLDNHAGQNFLIDEAVLRSMVELARIQPNDTVVEIGAGFGTLTAELIKRAREVIAVEKDKTLARCLKERFGGQSNFRLVNDDILKFKPDVRPYRIIANIPYQITGKIIRKFVSEEERKPADMLIMVQKEVGERVCARPGQMSLLAIWVQLYSQPAIVMPVSRQSFWPVPKVDSVLLSIAGIKPDPLYPLKDFTAFWRVLRVGFSSPRKQLRNNLVAGLRIPSKEVARALAQAGIAEKARAQELSISDWIALANSPRGRVDP